MKSPLSDKTWFAIGFALFFAILGCVGYLSQARWLRDDISTQVSEQVVLEPSVAPSASPMAPKEMVFAVWNGSGVSGQAAKLATLIEADGLKVVEVKNAPERASETSVYLSDAAELRRELVAKYVGVGARFLRLETKFAYDVLIVIGEK